MAFGLPQDQRSQVMLLVVVACLAGGYFFWSKVQNPRREEVIAAQAQIDSLSAIIRKAKADLASGSVESMRRAVERYRAALGLMRRLVPEQNEVPSLLEDISNRAKVRGISLGSFQPLPPEPGPPLALAFHDAADSAKAKNGAAGVRHLSLSPAGVRALRPDRRVPRRRREPAPDHGAAESGPEAGGPADAADGGRHDGRVARSELRLADLRKADFERDGHRGGNGKCASVVC